MGYIDSMNLYGYVDSVGKLGIQTDFYNYASNDLIDKIDPMGLAVLRNFGY